MFSAKTQAAGATLFLSPSSGTYTVNKNFTVKVMVNSGGGVGINAAEGVINYDTSFLKVASISESGSIFKLWTNNPANSGNKISFGGGLPGAYTGNAGLIFSIVFTPLKAGETSVSFSSGSVLEYGPSGKNIFSGFGNAKFTITEAKKTESKKKKIEKKKKEEPKAKGILPPLPEVNSPTHPDPDTWYADNNPEFVWKLLSDLTGVSFLITQSKDSNPGQNSDGVIESKQFEDVPDGVNYFHIKYQNKFGWGQIAHRKFMVDVTPPEAFDLKLDNENDRTNPTPKLVFSTKDKASGIDYFEIVLNGEKSKVTAGEVSRGYYQFQPLAPGEYEAQVVAVDKAKNTASSSVKFFVEALKAPIITSIPKTISNKDELVIQGTSFYPRVNVKVYIGTNKENAEEATVQTDDSGNWSYFHKGYLKKGTYQVWAKIVDNRGAQSLDSANHILLVESLSIIEAYGLYIIIFLLFLLVMAVLYILYLRKECKIQKDRIKRETEELKAKLSKIFAALREELAELIEFADRRKGLSESERRVKEKFQESLDISEEFIGKEVEDIEKEIK